MKKYIIPTSTVIEMKAESMLAQSSTSPSINDHKYNSGVEGAGTQYSGHRAWGSDDIWGEEE